MPTHRLRAPRSGSRRVFSIRVAGRQQVLRREPPSPYGEHPLSVIYVGTMTRERCERIAWNTPAAVDAALDADDLLIDAKGATKSLVPLDLTKRPDLAEVVRQFESTLTQPMAPQ